jgi:protease-4
MPEENRSRPALGFFGFLLLLALAIGGGWYFAPSWTPEPKIGIIRLSYDIYSLTADEIVQQLKYARDHEDVEAVVLIINSPGGSASYSEELYLDVLHTRRDMPVVATIDLLAASGAYYMAAAADEIYAKPTSFVGSVGVIASFPGPVYIDDSVLTTGPYKLFGGTKDGTVRQVEMAKFAFLEAVRIGRGERLQISLDELSRAEIYSGIQAQRFGLIDHLGSTEQAIERAAELAGYKTYEVVELYPLVFEADEDDTNTRLPYRPQPIDAAKLWSAPVSLAPGLYYRLFEPVHP